MSMASIVIAQRRAEIRGLTNITWVHDSLLNLPARAAEFGIYDYINCSGVLHHLADPDQGLKALLSVLRQSGEFPGAIGVMVYATVGRTGVYQMQSLMRLVNEKPDMEPMDMASKIINTRDMLGSLPSTNWFIRGEELYKDHKNGDAGL
jgi:2-polyprenyl-3-methyl-5-hydroxy-6-metoxy-1,4-benzoquinol methylase